MCHEHGDSITLLCYWQGFPKHLYSLYLAFYSLQIAYLDLIAWFCPSIGDCTSQNCPFTFYLEAVIDQDSELSLAIALWDLELSQQSFFEINNIFFNIFLGRARNHCHCLSEFSFGKDFSKSSYFGSQQFFLQSIHFIEHNNEVFDEHFRNYYALSSLSLNSFVDVNHQKHQVNDLSPSYNCSDQRGMTGTIDQSKLEVLFLHFGLQFFRNPSNERRKTQVKSDSSLFGLWAFIKAGCRCDLRQSSTQRSLARINMTKDSNIDINAFVGFEFLKFRFFDVKQFLLHTCCYNPIIREMKLNQAPSFYGSQKADKLGLTSHRFREKHVSHHAEEEMDNIKRKDRSDIEVLQMLKQLSEWRTSKFYKTDATKQLFRCPQQIATENADDLSLDDFIEKYEKKNLPVLIKGCTKNWKAEKYWNFEYFYRNFKDLKFKVGEDDDGYKLRVQLKYYFEYLVYNRDDSPLYLFESSLENNKDMMPILDHYTVPIYFQDDLLKYAGEKERPPYRWLLMGPERSGTTVHVDPLDTSAWNTSLQGHKRWVLFPEHIPKFIVKGKAFRGPKYQDEAINYYTEILPKIIQSEGREQLGIIEFIQGPEETVFIPGGWWHAVINLDDTMAVTQNVMTHTNFDKVWRSMRCERRKFAKRFLEKLKEYEPTLYDRAVQLNEKDKFKMGEKYEEQSVSLSFTPTESSSSSSSEDFQSSSGDSKRSQSLKSRQASRSREKTKKRSQTSERQRAKRRSH